MGAPPPGGARRFLADLHVHSRYSIATSRDCDLVHLAAAAAAKGLTVVATGDLTHPAWRAELTAGLVEAEPGLFQLRPDLWRTVSAGLAPGCREPVRFLCSGEISTVYRHDGRTRRVHHLVYLPDLAAAGRLVGLLERVGNLASDGRPVLRCDSRDLLEMALASSDDAFVVPAHVFTPWYSVLGARSGFDSIEECYRDLAGHVFALETGLSADPAMIRRISALDRYTLVSSSDAHSPGTLGREATAFRTELSFGAIRGALAGGGGLAGTVELFPEEGKYFLDGHRSCGVRCTPAEHRRLGGTCPVCGRPLTVGVAHRVEDLADRPPGPTEPFRSLVPLAEIVGEVLGRAPRTKSVRTAVEGLVGRLGPELAILTEVPVDEIARGPGGAQVAEAVRRLRRGEVEREPGYDGRYGTIRLLNTA